MKTIDVALCIVCMALGSSGQVLLRLASLQAADSANGWRGWLSWSALAAVLVYGAGLLLWTWVLSRTPLTQAFAFFGLSFFVVPMMAHQFLGDPIGPNTWIGGALIMSGIVVAAWPTQT